MNHLIIIYPILMGLFSTSNVSPADPVDYQKIAVEMEWDFKLDRSTILTSLLEPHAEYTVSVTSSALRPEKLVISFWLDGIKKYEWTGHGHSLFKIIDNNLYYASFDTIDTGADIVAVDLISGKEIWRSPVKGIGSPDHSAYANFLNIKIRAESVIIYGCETMGDYVEIKLLRTGETVGHKQFVRDGKPRKAGPAD